MKKIAAKMIAVMRECSHIAKNGTNSFHGYTYVTSADVLSKVNAALVEQGLATLVIPELISLEEVKTAKGSIEHFATVKLNITLIDRDSDDQRAYYGHRKRAGQRRQGCHEGADSSHQICLYAQSLHQHGRRSRGRCTDG